MRLLHFSQERFDGPVLSCMQFHGKGINRGTGRASKPHGFFVSANYDWLRWCVSEDFCMDTRFNFMCEITLKSDANVLRISTEEALLDFTNEYKYDSPSNRLSPYVDSYSVDWKRVAERYQAIIITPYLWTLRLDDRCNWYYPWDCASGVIWDADAIAAIRQIPGCVWHPFFQAYRLANRIYWAIYFKRYAWERFVKRVRLIARLT